MKKLLLIPLFFYTIIIIPICFIQAIYEIITGKEEDYEDVYDSSIRALNY